MGWVISKQRQIDFLWFSSSQQSPRALYPNLWHSGPGLHHPLIVSHLPGGEGNISKKIYGNFSWLLPLGVWPLPGDWHFGFETFAKCLRVSVSENLVSEKESRFRKIWFRKKSLGFGFEKIWSRKKVSVSVSENLVSEKKSRFRFRKTLVSEKSLGFGKFGIVKKVSVSVSVKILVSSFSGVQ